MTHATHSTADHPIEVRNLRFPLADAPKYWLGGRRAVSLFFDQLSVLFPPGEAFFMNSVRAFEAEVTDPTLLGAMRAFHAQEALHGREHTHYNRRLAALGYPVEALERGARRRLHATERMYGARGRLAVTVALEHLTAMLAHVLLGEASPLQDAHPEMAALWRWHAAEESEHAAVAFDVFQAVGGSYLMRVAILVLVSFGFMSALVEHQLRMMWADRILFSAREWASLARFLLGKRGMIRRALRPYLRFYRRDFHPHDDVEGRALLDAWKREFASMPVYRDKLYVRAGAAQ
ncbi:MAG TPA: metal-dependent hydrolase [Polyangiales bacterium]